MFVRLIRPTLFLGRCFALPTHTKLALPNLSPTMSKGNIAKWLIKEGDEFKAGDAIADIETDKATVAFEMLDSGILAKILVPEGTKDVPLGTIIAVACRNKSDITQFKDYQLDGSSKPESIKQKPIPESPKVTTPTIEQIADVPSKAYPVH